MERRALLFGVIAAAGVVPACSARGADGGDLATAIEPTPPVPDSGVAPGSDGTKRLDNYLCAKPPPPATPTKMVPVAAGPFLMGCNPGVDKECNRDELPTHTVTLRAYTIDATEVSQVQYWECFKAGACLAPVCDWDPCGVRINHPVACVDHVDATKYCAWQKKRLPTEAEWEKAARGPDGLKYPWGNQGVDCTRTNMEGCRAGLDGKEGAAPVGTHPAGASPYGALDMAGNIAEWVADYYDVGYYARSPKENPTGPATASAFVGRGGGWRSVPYWQRTSVRDDYSSNYFKNSGGFRCAQ